MKVESERNLSLRARAWKDAGRRVRRVGRVSGLVWKGLKFKMRSVDIAYLGGQVPSNE